MPNPSRRSFLLSAFEQIGEVGILVFKMFDNLFRRPREHKSLIHQIAEVGAASLPVVSLTAAFGGLVFGLQTYMALHRYIGPGSEGYGGSIISTGLAKELIPILVGLMVSGRVGSSMAAEIGTMKITEQVDALFSLGANPVRYLVVPRTLACLFMLPCLTLYGDFIGIGCGYFYNVVIEGVNRTVYIQNTLMYFEVWDVFTGLIKAAIFGVVIAIIGCWQGLKTEGGAEGVGRATTRTVVIASILILILNFFLTRALPPTLRT